MRSRWLITNIKDSDGGARLLKIKLLIFDYMGPPKCKSQSMPLQLPTKLKLTRLDVIPWYINHFSFSSHMNPTQL